MTDLISYPSHLYKYQRLTAHSLGSILNDTVWLSKPPTFNDPFDCAITLSKDKFEESRAHAVAEIAKTHSISREKLTQFDEKLVKDDRAAYEQLRASLRLLLQNIGILSLSAISDHILMWSHYADHHKGFCVEYDCGEETELKKLANPVKYEEEIPSLSAVDVIGATKYNFLNVALFTKASQWKYEEEWRLVMHEGGRTYQAPSKVTAIIFGARMPVEEKVMVYRSLRHKAGIRFKEAQIREDRFGINITDFSI